VMSGGHQGFQHGNRKIRGAHENQAHQSFPSFWAF
jgi:hypothetical protein